MKIMIITTIALALFVIITLCCNIRLRVKCHALEEDYDEIADRLSKTENRLMFRDRLREGYKRILARYGQLKKSAELEIRQHANGSFALITGEGNEYALIKIFRYDPSDEEDRQFALREAQELMEAIDKA